MKRLLSLALFFAMLGAYGPPIDNGALKHNLRAVANPPGIRVDARNLKGALKLIARGIDVDYQGVSGPCDFDGHGDVPGSFEVWRFSGGSIETVTFIAVER